MDLRQGEPAARDGRAVPAEQAEPVGVCRNRAVRDRAALPIANERANITARAPHGARTPAVVDCRRGVGEPPYEAAVVAAGGAHVAARHAVGDCGRNVDVADEAADEAIAANEAVRAASDDRIDRTAAVAGADQPSGVGTGRRDLDRRRTVTDDRSAGGAPYEAADVLFPRYRSRDGDAFDRRITNAAEKPAAAVRRRIVRADEVADGMAVAMERAGERRRFIADWRPVCAAKVDVRAERVGAG